MRRLLLILALSGCAFGQLGNGSLSGKLTWGVPGSTGSTSGGFFDTCLLSSTSGWTPITQCGSITSSGNYYLPADLTCNDSALTPTANNVVVNLNGKTITYSDNPTVFPFAGVAVTRGTGNDTVNTGKGMYAAIVQFDSVYSLAADGVTHINYAYGTDYWGCIDPVRATGHNCASGKEIAWISGHGPATGATYYVSGKVKEPGYAVAATNLNNTTFGGFATIPIQNNGSSVTVSCGYLKASTNAAPFSHAILANYKSGWVTDHIIYNDTNPDNWNQGFFFRDGSSGAGPTITNIQADSKARWVTSRDNNHGAMFRVNGAGAAPGLQMSNVDITDSAQQAVLSFPTGSVIHDVTCSLRYKYTNGFCFSANNNTELYNSKVSCFDPLHMSASDTLTRGCRGIYMNGAPYVHNNWVLNFGPPNNAEYGGCEIGTGPFGMQSEGSGSDRDESNEVTTIAYECDARARRWTNGSNNTGYSLGSTFRALRYSAATAKPAIGISIYQSTFGTSPIGYLIKDATVETDQYGFALEFASTGIRMKGVTFVKGTTNPDYTCGTEKYGVCSHVVSSGWAPWRFTAASDIDCVDCSATNGTGQTGASLTTVSATVAGYNLRLMYTRTFNVTSTGSPVSGATVTMTDAQGTDYVGLTDASGVAKIEVPQYTITGTGPTVTSRNPYSLSITATGCTTISATGISVTGTSTDNRSMVCPNTTASIESGNNTSAADTFTASGWTNGTLPAGNVSKVDVHSLLYSGSTSKVFAHVVGWFGNSGHQSVGYTDDNATQAGKMVADMKSRGLDGLKQYWKGSGTFSDTVAGYVVTAAASQGLLYAQSIDKSAFTCTTQSGCTTQLINHLTYLAQNRFTSSAYYKIGGRPVVFFFDFPDAGVDWTAVQANATVASANPIYIFENSGGFTFASTSGGAFAWITGTFGDPNDWGSSYLQNFYTVAKANPSKYAWGSAKKGFDDSEASWGSGRVINQNCGQTWLSTWNLINTNYSSSTQLHGVNLPTWDDYEEGTELETGIDNCVSFSSFTGSGSTLTWAITGQESTLDHFEIFVSSDGTNLQKLATVAASSRSLNLSSYNLTGTLKFFVKAVGKPFFVNKLSSQVTLTL